MRCQKFIVVCTRAVLLLLAPIHLAGASTVLVLGDSLSAAYGIELEQGWVHLLADRIGPEHRVVNASISGDTTFGGLTRLDRALASHRPDVVIVGLGGNDGLRGLPLSEIRANLERIVAQSLDAGARVVLAGMKIPPNLGPVYTERFAALYRDVASRHDVRLVPFLLDGVAARPGMMQNDGLHPTASAQVRILENVWPLLEPLLDPR